MENQNEFEFDEYYNRYFNFLTNRRSYNQSGGLKYIQKFDLTQSSLDKLTIEQVIAKAINKFEVDELPARTLVRSDAKLFLMINYRTMVYFPLKDSTKFSELELKKEIFSEVQKILKTAQEISTEISAHQVLIAGNKIWDSLKTLSNGSW